MTVMFSVADFDSCCDQSEPIAASTDQVSFIIRVVFVLPDQPAKNSC